MNSISSFWGEVFLRILNMIFLNIFQEKSLATKKLSILLKYYYGLTDYHPSLNNIVNRFNEKMGNVFRI